MTEQKNPYDIREATALLARSRARRAPQDFYKDRELALRKLLQAVMESANAADYETGQERLAWVVSHVRQGAVFINVVDSRLVVTADGPRQVQVTSDEMAIEYDPIEKIFVGKEEDVFYTPEPGKPRKRRSAVGVVAEAIIKMIDAQAEARRAR